MHFFSGTEPQEVRGKFDDVVLVIIASKGTSLMSTQRTATFQKCRIKPKRSFSNMGKAQAKIL